MQKELRKVFNDNFSEEKYEAYLQKIEDLHPGALDFRNAETPLFVPKDFTQKMLDACEDIIDVIVKPDFISLTNRSIPKNIAVPNESAYSDFIAFDFGVCENDKGELEPQLIEMQGFPTLFAFEVLVDDVFKNHFQVPENFSSYLGGYEKETYLQLLRVL